MGGARVEPFAFDDAARKRIKASAAVSDAFLDDVAVWVTAHRLEAGEATPAEEHAKVETIQAVAVQFIQALDDLDGPHVLGALGFMCRRTGAPAPVTLRAELRAFGDALELARREAPEPRRGRTASRARREIAGRIAEEARRIGLDARAAEPLFREVYASAGLDFADPEREARRAFRLLRQE